MPGVNVPLPDDLHARLQAVAKAEGRSMRMQALHLIREGLDRRLPAREAPPPEPTDPPRS